VKNQSLILGKSSDFYDVIKKLDENGEGILTIIDSKGCLIGLVTDGDVRRAVLNKQLNIEHVINKHPYKLTTESTTEQRTALLKKVNRQHLPIVDKDNKLIEVFALDDATFRVMPNTIVIMAGGLGKRLGKLTKETPKPMLKVGEKPLLDVILATFIDHGFHKFYISVNYKKHIIMDYFGDGSKWGVSIKYLIEDKKLGTAGSLSLIREKLKHPLIVTNGDVMTSLDYDAFIMHHVRKKSSATMCIRKHDHVIPYGVIEVEDDRIISLSEKPKITFNINTGVYVLDPDIIKKIPSNTFYDMTELFEKISKDGQKTFTYTLKDYWIDIGHTDMFYQANKDIMHN
jgi:dTDP-glucose pyrophosphorylase